MSGLSSSMPVEAYRTIESAPATSTPEVVAPPAASPAAGDSTAIPADAAMLIVDVPSNAKIFVNGAATKATGETRRYISRGLVAGKEYEFVVRMAVDRDGVTAEETRTVSLTAGEGSKVSFATAPVAKKAPTTKVTLHVPADAKVWLAGNATGSIGAVRQFETTSLAAGQSWKSYEIRVAAIVEGRERVVSKVIDLAAGDSVDLSIDPAESLATLADATASLR
jgi:uncharacterized protein (TIGR03000 family)